MRFLSQSFYFNQPRKFLFLLLPSDDDEIWRLITGLCHCSLLFFQSRGTIILFWAFFCFPPSLCVCVSSFFLPYFHKADEDLASLLVYLSAFLSY